jgi:hypothetical protein
VQAHIRGYLSGPSTSSECEVIPDLNGEAITSHSKELGNERVGLFSNKKIPRRCQENQSLREGRGRISQ